MILVVGATGRLGRAIAERLLQDGVPFRAACRSAAKARSLFARGVEVVEIDLERGTGIAEAMAGAERVVTCIHGLLGRSRHSIRRVDVDGHRRLIDAAVEARVERFVYLSALGASPDHPSEFWRAKARTEEYLKNSGLNYVILRPSAFMELYAHDLIGAPVLRGRRVFLLGSGNSRRNLVAVADVAEAARLALFQPDLAGQTLVVGGPDNPTEREVAQLYASLSSRPAKVRAVPAPLLRVLAAAISPLHAGVGHVLRLPMQLAGREDLCWEPPPPGQAAVPDATRLSDFVSGKVGAARAAASGGEGSG